MKAPAFQLYARDFIVGTAMMSAEEVGAYIRLMCYQWDNGPLPNDDAMLCRLAGCGGNAVASIRHKFGTTSDGRLANSRLEEVREQQRVYAERQAVNAKTGWEKRKKHGLAMPSQCQANATAYAKPMPESCSASPTPSALNTIAPTKPARARNELLDCLAAVDGSNPDQVTPTAWPAIATALKAIKAVCPSVTVDEIQRRARNYAQKHPDWSLTPNALAKNWAGCERGTNQMATKNLPPINEPNGWKAFLNHHCEGSVYGANSEREAHQWSDIDRQTQGWLVGQMKAKGVL